MKRMVLASGLLAWAAVASATTGTVYVPARPIEVSEPKVDPTAGGWVHVSYIVQANGAVGEVVVLDSSGSETLEKSVVEAVTNWKYQPATLNGEPVPQRLDDRLVVVKWSPGDRASREKYEALFTHVIQLIKDRHYDAAELNLVRARDDGAVTHAAWARIHLLLSYIDEGRGDKARQIENLLAAIPYAQYSFKISDVDIMVRTLFKLQVDLKMYRAALDTHARLKRAGGLDKDGNIERIARQLSDLVAGTDGFAVGAEIEQRGSSTANASWHYEILRRRIAFTEVDGMLDTFEVRCATHIFADKIDTEREWTLPEAWGDCILLVFGQPGSRFKLLELPPLAP